MDYAKCTTVDFVLTVRTRKNPLTCTEFRGIVLLQHICFKQCNDHVRHNSINYGAHFLDGAHRTIFMTIILCNYG